MIKVRASDSTILAGTHGAGLWWGKVEQGDAVPLSTDQVKEQEISFYPNPFIGVVSINEPGVGSVEIVSISGLKHSVIPVINGQADLSALPSGSWIAVPIDHAGNRLTPQKLIKKE